MTSLLPISKCYLERNMSHGGFDVQLIGTHSPRHVELVCPIGNVTLLRVESGTYSPPAPTFYLDQDGAQALLDGLWSAGIRPASGIGKETAANIEVITCMQAHLDDLRRVAFGQEMEQASKDIPQLTINHF